MRACYQIGIAMMVLMLACGSDVDTSDPPGAGGAGQCPCGIANVEDTASVLVGTTASMVTEMAQACAAIATALGQSGVPDVSGDVTNDELVLACDLAKAGIQASGGLSITVGLGACAVDHQGQHACELAVSGGTCDEDPLDRCGALAWGCGGQCTECIWNGTTALACTGTCDGVCYGACSGPCSPVNAAGQCEGACTGGCAGDCIGSCDGATCYGGWCTGVCDGAVTKLGCLERIGIPHCPMDASCASLCIARGLAGSTCATPAVAVDAGPAVLESQLPVIVRTSQLCPLLLDSAQTAIGAVLAADDACQQEGITFKQLFTDTRSTLELVCATIEALEGSVGL